MCNKKSSSVKTEELFVGLLGFEPRITGPESVVLPLHHSPNLCCQIPPLEFDGAKISLFFKPAKKLHLFSSISCLRLLGWALNWLIYMLMHSDKLTKNSEM